MKFKLSKIADCLEVETPLKDREITGYSIDTRTIRTGDLFFAIRGTVQDGHQYVPAAFENGASAAVVRTTWAVEHETNGPILAVPEPSHALSQLACHSRLDWGKPLVAITGSNGKTTTKELTAAILETRYKVAKSLGNLNNELGLPLSLLRFDEKSEVGVVEMGMNHMGEIRRLTNIAAPSIAVVTNVNAVHLEHFSSVDEIASAKRELIEQLPNSGTAILNNDDPRVASFRAAHSGPVITFGIEQPADFQAVNVETFGAQGVRFVLKVGIGRQRKRLQFESPLPGRHNISNILAALATASTLDIDAEQAHNLIASFQPRKMRGEISHIGGITLLDDCYNSNPQALSEMLTVLKETSATRRIAVLGEMLELGSETPALHAESGRKVAEASIDLLIVIGEVARKVAVGATEEGFPPNAVFYFEDVMAASSFLVDTLECGDAVLLKASRRVGLEQALEAIKQNLETPRTGK
ncbi:MAG: UDP-N-acetylmuramoyl-tripeptide--D-alanyl-D-alanine ligase [Solibacterales bacterium]|nr:UDP-N-acetylmuramoyl-tripeptide--D-alanyl-D-alanine ligase [Bryobacterales bacterium]|tara:strand:- start:7185 stop:8591 length:1407 start_codon:yes stop_codon:yes gene_type:complete